MKPLLWLFAAVAVSALLAYSGVPAWAWVLPIAYCAGWMSAEVTR